MKHPLENLRNLMEKTLFVLQFIWVCL